MAHKNISLEQQRDQAFRLHQRGDWAAATDGYRRLLASHPHDARTLYLLGSVLAQQGQWEQALGPLSEAAALEPTLAEAHNNRGIALKELGRTEEALLAYDDALAARPHYAEAFNNKGAALQSLGHFSEARDCFTQAVEIKPAYAEAHNNRGIAFGILGQPDNAALCYEEALRADPMFARAHNNLGNIRMGQACFAEALACYDRALQAGGDAAAEVHNNRGTALKELSRFDEARAAFTRALELQAAYPDALSNLASCLTTEGRLSEALQAFDLALSLDPQHVDAHWNRSLALLMAGDWERGWAEYEWRFRKFVSPPPSEKPRWQGEPLDGKTILVYAEQGAGDTLEFVRYLPLVKARGAQVAFCCPPSLHALLASCPGIDTLLAPGEVVPHDVHIPLLSLPGVYGTTPTSIPSTVPYLSVPDAQARAWQARLEAAAPGAVKVGLCWAGSPEHKNDHNRSCALSDLAPLAGVPGVAFFSLQKGAASAQAAAPPPGLSVIDLTEDVGDYADTAALIAGLDLVISVDTSVAHLAGALGRPVWTLLAYGTSWHFLAGRADMPWYPTMRLFRQSAPLDWVGVADSVARTLTAAVALPLCDLLAEQGEAAFAQGDFSAAQEAWAGAQEIMSGHVRTLSNLAALAYTEGDYPLAAQPLIQAVEQHPGDLALLEDLARCHMAAEQYADAIAVLEKAVALHPNLADLHVLLAVCRTHHTPLISIVMPCYKQAQYLEEAVASVVAQTYPRWEIVIVNDGSPDNTSEVARAVIARYPGRAIHLVEQPNSGVSVARNTGVAASHGEYLLPMDADDLLRPSFLAKTLRLLEDSPHLSVAYTDIEFFGATEGTERKGPFTLDFMRLQDTVVCTCLFRRAVFDAVGGYAHSDDLDDFEDWDFWIAVLEQGFQGAGVPEPLFLYRIKMSSKVTEALKRRPLWTAQIVCRHPHLYDPARVAEARALLAQPREAVAPAAPCPLPAPDAPRPRVLIAALSFWPRRGDEEQRAEDLGASLVDSGFEVEVATPRLPEREGETYRGMRIHSLTGGLEFAFRLLVDARCPDVVVIVGGPDVPFMATAACVPSDGPRVVLLPTITPDIYKYMQRKPQARRALAHAARRADVTVCSTEQGTDAQLLAEMGIESVYLPAAARRAEPRAGFRARHGLAPDKPLLLALGELVHEKGHADLLHALRDHPGDWQLVVMGSPNIQAPHLDTHLAYLATLDPRVTLIQGASPEDAAGALAEADLLLPSLSDGAPPTLAEAQSFGLPWLATPECGAAPGSAGGLVLPLEQFGAGVDYLLHNPAERAALGAAGRAAWEACGAWDIVGPRLAALVRGENTLPPLAAPPSALRATEDVQARFAAQYAPPPALPRPEISVVICSHNRVGLLGRILPAYAAQTLPRERFEVIVVDDGSSDGTADFLHNYRADFALTPVILTPNRGLSAARNQGLLHARGELVVFADDDDAPLPSYLEEHVRVHGLFPEENMGVMGRIDPGPETADSLTYHVLTKFPGLYNHFDDLKEGQVLDYKYFWMNVVSVKRSLLLRCGFYDEATRWGLDDAELGFRLRTVGLRLIHNPAAGMLAVRTLSFADLCRRQNKIGGAAAWLQRKYQDIDLPFWLGTYNAEDRLAALEEKIGTYESLSAQFDRLEKVGLSVMAGHPDFHSTLAPTLAGLCYPVVQYHYLSGYLQRLRAQQAEDDAHPVPLAREPRVGVVIPCYNYARFLPEAIASLAAQTYTHWEAIIVDDGSPDDTIPVAEDLIARYPEHSIRLITTPNTGHPAHARNTGIAATDAPYILCLDADDTLAPTFLTETVRLLEANPHLSIAYTDQVRFYDDGREELHHCGDYSVNELTRYLPLGVFALFRRVAWTDTGGWRAVGYEDWDFWLSCAEKGHGAMRIPRPLSRYRKHGAGKYVQDEREGYANKAWLALNHPALYGTDYLRWAWGIADADRWLKASADAPLPQSTVSVVVTASGRSPQALAQALASLHAQTCPNVEIIVSGTGDAPLGPLPGALTLESPRVVPLAEARNRGLEAATGKYVAYLSEDARFLPNHLALLAGFLESNHYRAAFANVDGGGDAPPPAGFDTARILVQPSVPLIGLMHERALLASVGPFDPSLPAHDDWEFTLRLSRLFTLAHLPAVTAAHQDTPPAASPEDSLAATRMVYERYASLAEASPGIPAAQAAVLDALAALSPERAEDAPALSPTVILNPAVCRQLRLDPHRRCPCGSGKKLKACHYNKPIDRARVAPLSPSAPAKPPALARP